MYEYYFKIKKGDIEFECSTNDKITFEEKLSDWINGIVRGEYVAPPKDNSIPAVKADSEIKDKPQRSGFIDVKNLASINEMTTPRFNSSLLADEIERDLSKINFEDALKESVENPKTEVIEKTDTIAEFEGYLNSYNPQSDMDRLIIAAKYILNNENQECFSIKQLNSKLVPAKEKPVDHSLIESAIAQEYIKKVPDLTGTSEISEYTLTSAGEGYFIE